MLLCVTLCSSWYAVLVESTAAKSADHMFIIIMMPLIDILLKFVIQFRTVIADFSSFATLLSRDADFCTVR